MGLVYDSTYFINSVRLTESSGLVNATNPVYFFGPSQKFSFDSTCEYTIGFNIGCKNLSPISQSRVDVYLTGTSFPSLDPYGHLLDSFVLNGPDQTIDFGKQQYTFVPSRTGTAKLRFIVWAGNWNVSQVQVFSAIEAGFNPDQGVLYIPVLNKRHENVQFKVDLYDVNNNLVPIKLESQTIYFVGQNLVVQGDDNKIDGTITILPSGSSGSVGIVLTGNAPGQNGPAIYTGIGTPGSSSTPIFIGNSSGSNVITIGDKFLGSTSGSTTSIKVSASVAVYDTSASQWKDVRDVIASSSFVNNPYLQEQINQNAVTASYNLNYSSSVLTASLISVSTSLAQKQVADSASFAYQLRYYSASNTQYSASVNIIDTFNRIIVPTSIGSRNASGLYLESASMGYYNVTQLNYPVYIGANGSFRFADETSYVGGSDPYTRMIGMAGGIFIVRTNALYMSASGFLLQATSSVSSSANVMKIGTVTNAGVGAGIYMDGAGTFRAGDPAGSNIYADSSQVRINTTQLTMNAGGIYMLADPNQASTNVIKVGLNASSLSLNNGAGFYADGSGNFRVGSDVTGSNYIQFTPGNALFIKANTFDLASTANLAGGPATLRVNTSFIALGQPAPAAFNPQVGTTGFYVDNQGQFFIGSSSYVNPTQPQNQNGNFISYGGKILNIRSDIFRFSGGTSGGGLMIIDSANNGLISLGSATAMSTGTGFYADGFGHFRVGNPGGQSISWDGTTLNVQGNLNITSIGGMPTQSLVNNLQGTQCNLNPDMSLDMGYAPYDNNATGRVGILYGDSQTIINDGGSAAQAVIPNGSGRILRVFTNGGTGATPTPGYAGFYISNPATGYFGIDSGVSKPGYYHKGSVLIFKITALLPSGWVLSFASNPIGNEAVIQWLTSQIGTSGWQTYILKVTIGITGTFSYTGFFFINPPPGTQQGSQLVGPNTYNTVGGFAFYVAQCDIIDVTQVSTPSSLIQGSRLPDVTPKSSGLYMSSQYLGFYNGSSWSTSTYIQSNGAFRFSGNASNYISWDGSTFAIKANAFTLQATGLTVDSVSGTIKLGNATGFLAGQGIYMDNSGNFSVVSSNGASSFYMNNTSLGMSNVQIYTNFGITTPTVYAYGDGTHASGLYGAVKDASGTGSHATFAIFNNPNDYSNTYIGPALTGDNSQKLNINFASMSFNGVPPIPKPVIVGDWSGNAAGASLAAALANLGLITNQTTNSGQSYTPPSPTPPPYYPPSPSGSVIQPQ